MTQSQVPRQFRYWKILLPILIGLSVTAYLLFRDFDGQSFANIDWTYQTAFWLFMGLLMMGLRDLGYIIRIRILTDKQLSWRQSFNSIMLWELSSAISPSVVGGSGIAMFILNREKIPLGKSTAIVLITALMDELFYILMVPACVLLAGWANLFPIQMNEQLFGLSMGIKGIFYAGYIFIFLLTSVILLSVFFFPHKFKRVIVRFFSIRFLRRWQRKAIQTGNEVVITSIELKGKKFNFWFKTFVATFLSWSARFFVLNFIIMAFMAVTLNDHFIIYARQMVMWVIMLISPTPGSSGIAELVFEGFLKEYTLNNLGAFQAFLWRLLSYYPYLIIGFIILPRWFKRTKSTTPNDNTEAGTY